MSIWYQRHAVLTLLSNPSHTLSIHVIFFYCVLAAAAYEVPEDNLIADLADQYDAGRMNDVLLETEPEFYDSEDEDFESFDEDEEVEMSGALPSALIADDQCASFLPSQTSAFPFGRHYAFTREFFGFVGGPVPSSKCSAQRAVEKTKIKSAQQCATTCANDDASGQGDGYTLLGYNYNCHTKKCDCLRGEEGYDLDSHVRTGTGYWACYKSDTATVPTPTPPPFTTQCLPNTVTGNAGGNTVSFARVDPQSSHTTCNVGSSFLPKTLDSVEECADSCAERQFSSGGSVGGIRLTGFDYSCDSNRCTCLTGHGGTNLRNNVQLTNANMACYMIE